MKNRVDFNWNDWYHKSVVSCRMLLQRGVENLMMKSTGIVRKVDELGRIVLPIELRRTLGIDEKDALEIYVDQEKIILKKYEPACVFCGNASENQLFHGKNVCRDCAIAMGETVSGNSESKAV
jgi:transcriptional pleiotropic regulator of transition state genes